MWTAKITDKKFSGGVVSISVSFSDGTEDFVEVLRANDATSLNSMIDARLKSLANTKSFIESLTLGSFTPTEKPPVVQSAMSKLAEVTRFVDLGVIAKTDKEYTDALAAAQAEHNA